MDDRFARPASAPRPGSPVRAIAGAALAAFLLGGVCVWLLIRPGGISADGLFRIAPDSSVEAAPDAPPPAPAEQAPAAAPVNEASAQEVERVSERQGGLDQRLAAMEQRLARLDLQAEAASGNAARAEGLLIAFAARRAVERGAPLGILADQLRLRFGDARPNAVAAVIEASRDPVTLDQLLARLDGLAPRLLESDVRTTGAWNWLSRELGELFVVRREDAPSPASANRLERARLFLESGRAGAAASEIENIPNNERAADWISDARRYAEVQRALELLELTAILEPRELRAASGERVEQRSPTDEAAPR